MTVEVAEPYKFKCLVVGFVKMVCILSVLLNIVKKPKIFHGTT